MEARADHQTQRRFNTLYGITVTIGAFLVASVLFWGVHYRGGYAWPTDDIVDEKSATRKLQFNWHPLLMVTSLVFLFGNSMMIYRARRTAPKKQLKLAHTVLHVTAFVLAVIGLQAVFDFHNYTAKPNLYSLHSWLGLSTIILFSMQLVGGFTTFLYPGLSHEMRATVLPVHTGLGAANFLLAVISATTGITESAIFTLGATYSKMPSEGFFMNFMAMLVVVFGGLVLYLVGEVAYKRANVNDDQAGLNIE